MSQSFWNDFLEKSTQFQVDYPVIYKRLAQCKLASITEDKIVIDCYDGGVKILFNSKRSIIQKYIDAYAGRKMSMDFVLNEQTQTVKDKKKKEKELPLLTYEPPKEDLLARSGLNIKHTFENFAVSPSNQVAFAASQAVAKTPGKAYNPLFLYGDVGVGKTHLAQAIGITILEDNADKKVFFCPGDQFTNELIEAIREKNTQKFRKKYRPLHLIIIDDIQFIAGKQTVQEEFFHTFNTIISAGGQVILTSDRPPNEIKNLEDRLRSRFSGGLIVDIQEPDFELRSAIVLIKAEEKNIDIDIEAARMIAELIEDTRTLEGTLLSIYARTVGIKDRVEEQDVSEFFNQKVQRTVKRVSPHDVIKTVCSYYNIKQSHIKGPGRTNQLAQARQLIMYILRTQFNMNFTDIAETLKRKDHTTVMHGAEKITRMLLKDPQFKTEVDTIISSLQLST